METIMINSNNIMKSNLIELAYVEFAHDDKVHMHDAIELVYIVSGNGEHIVDGRKEKVSGGSLILINHGQTHSFNVIGSMDYFNMLLKPEFISKELMGCNDFRDILTYFNYESEMNFENIYFENEERERIESLLLTILKDGIEHGYAYLKCVRANVELLIHLIVRRIMKEKKRNTDKENEIINEAIRYICENCAEALNVADVSKKFNYSQDYFSYLLKLETGLRFKQFLVEKRMQKAMGLLLSKRKIYTIEDIMKECGYSNKTFFYKTFKSHFGVVPKVVKKYKDNYEEYIKGKIVK